MDRFSDRGSTPLISTSGKLPLPIIGGVLRYAKPYSTMVRFGYNSDCSTKTERAA